ncbi:glycosyltransferase [Halalkalicoccus subterraneus]|uniref:glycosyltransferase n=1 Tax=Halalkalicoccus subterraneus TaxID=2675002 RepID=UPI000EFC8B77|nr:glycosyltransferase [Halalkalicoccus subterraneus]
MNIVYSAFRFPKLSESFILNEIYELKSRGHNVVVFAHTDPMEETTHKEIDNLNLPVYHAGPPQLTYQCAKNVLQSFSNPSFYRFGESSLNVPSKFFNAHLLSEFENFLTKLEFHPDLIHAHFTNVRRLPLVYVARKHEIPISVVPHAFGLFADPDYDALEILFNSVNHIISPTEYNKRYIEEHYLPDTSINVVPAVSQLGNREPTGGTVPNRVLTVGRFAEKKGYSYSIEAIAKVVEEYPDVEYHIVGEGNIEPKIRSLIREYGIEKNIEILQQISDDQLSKEYDEAAIFLLPCIIAENGDRDAAPVVLKEAMTMNTACVSTTVSAVPELITDGETGLLTPPRDPGATADAVKTLLKDTEYRDELATAGREHVRENLTPEKAVDKLERVFKEIITR